MSKPKVPPVSNTDLRSQLDADVAKFLKSGKKIQQIPTGISSQDYSKGRKHIVLGKSKQQGKVAEKVQDDEEDAPDKEQDDEASGEEDLPDEELDG